MTTLARCNRLIRCGLIGGLVLAASVTAAAPVAAARLDAADFAADCNDDGVVDVAGTQRYVGGVGIITRLCSVNLTDESSFVLRNVELTGPALVAGLQTVQNGTIKVIDSVITMSDPAPAAFGGVLELSTGGEGDEPGSNGRVVIRGSALTAGTFFAQASFDHPDGAVIIKDSTIETTVGMLTVRASDLNGSNGTVRIINSSLTAAEDIVVRSGVPDPASGSNGLSRVVSSVLRAPAGSIEVVSGPGGRTVVRDTRFESTPVTLTTGAGGICRSVDNTPAVSCV